MISGGNLAAGDLFDDDYQDCPHKTRLRDGQIADLAVARDAEEATEVNVSWTATDPATWGLGPNTYHTELVVILDDGGELDTQSLSLGSRKATFKGVRTGAEVEVQLAIVTNTADGQYLISDLLGAGTFQSLTKPAFSRGWRRVTVTGDPEPDVPGYQLHKAKDTDSKGTLAYVSKPLKAGRLYYVGYNENFGNYKSTDPALKTVPTTARLRIGLAHSDKESAGEREDVDFKAYVLRIVDADGDVVAEGDDVRTVKSDYGSEDFTYAINCDELGTAGDNCKDFNNNPVLKDGNPIVVEHKTIQIPNNLFLYGLVVAALPSSLVPVRPDSVFSPEDKVGGYVLSNVRVADGDEITPAVHSNPLLDTTFSYQGTTSPFRDTSKLAPNTLSMFQVNTVGIGRKFTSLPGIAGTTAGLLPRVGTVYALPPDAHRDFPIDTLSSDETYTITAWAVNKDGEVISPVAELKVRPKDTVQGQVTDFRDYRNNTDLADLATTEFTVLK